MEISQAIPKIAAAKVPTRKIALAKTQKWQAKILEAQCLTKIAVPVVAIAVATAIKIAIITKTLASELERPSEQKKDPSDNSAPSGGAGLRIGVKEGKICNFRKTEGAGHFSGDVAL